MKPLDCFDIYADAEFYEQEFAGRTHEIPFFVNEARMAHGPVLEIGCGTGRITLPIAAAGIDITGLDVSRPMLELARRKAEAAGLKPSWLEQDCRSVDTDRQFSLIFAPANALQHLHDLESVHLFLSSARRSLLPGGKLVLDVFNPDPAKLVRTAAMRHPHKKFSDAEGQEICVEVASEYNSAAQILSFTLYYASKGNLIRTKKVSMRCFYPEELLALCEHNQLTVTQRYGNYDRSAFGNSSPQQILICEPTGPAERTGVLVV